MKRSHLLCGLALVLLCGNAVAMDAEELIAKTVDAQGGLKALQAVKTSRVAGRFMMMGMEFPFTLLAERPNRLRIDAEFQGMKIVQAYDGTTAWSVNPMAGSADPQPMSPMEAKGFVLQADMDGPLIGWADKGYTVEYLGTADVEGTECHLLRIDTKQDIVMDIYIDGEYFLPVKQTSNMTFEGQQISQDTYMSDFKPVGDLVIAHSIETRMGGQVANQITLDSVENNVEIDSSLFDMPKTAAE